MHMVWQEQRRRQRAMMEQGIGGILDLRKCVRYDEGMLTEDGMHKRTMIIKEEVEMDGEIKLAN